MVDKSWGLTPSTPRPASPRPLSAAVPGGGSLASRLDERSAARAKLAEEREAARQAAREADAALRARDPHMAAAQRRRGSGRKDIVREDRDTSNYRMVADPDRIRALAARGASPESLADVLRLPIETIRQALAEG
jgi:hypothetical protein